MNALNAGALPPTDRDEEDLAAVPETALIVQGASDNHFSGINIGGNTVTVATEHLPEEQKILVRWLHNHARSNDWNWDEFERNTGLDKSTGWRIFKDEYRYPKTHRTKPGARIGLDGVCEKIAKFRALALARESVYSAGFLETSVWERIEWVCRRALVRNKLGFIYGISQIGKSTCLREFTRLNNGGQTTYVEMPPSAGVQLMTKTIAKALHVSTKKSYEGLIEDVLSALDGSKLLILDEIHRVFTTYQKGSVMRCLDVLRYIHDQTKCGMILCGTDVFRDELAEGEFFKYLLQLKRRGLYEVQLPDEPPQEDLDLIIRTFSLPAPTGQAAEIFAHIAKLEGFGQVITRLTDGKELATKAKEPFAWTHFVKAHNIVRRMAMKEGK